MSENDDRDAGIYARVREFGATRAVVRFSGGGDEGGPESLEFFAGDRDISPEDAAWELLDDLGAPIYDEWGGFAGEFHVDGKLHIEAEAQRMRLETTRLVEGEDYERESRSEEVLFVMGEVKATRAELPYSVGADGSVEAGPLRLQDDRGELEATDDLLREALHDFLEDHYEDQRGRRRTGVLVVDVADELVDVRELTSEEVPRRGLLGRLRRRGDG